MGTKGQGNSAALVRGIGTGVIGSLVGTIAMDLVMVVGFSMQGLPALTYLGLIGSIFGGGVPLGALIHLVVACFLGLVFIVPVLKVDALRIDTVIRGAVVGFLIGMASISACVPFAMLIREPIPTVLSFMAIPHLVWGTVTGLVVAYGLRLTAVNAA